MQKKMTSLNLYRKIRCRLRKTPLWNILRNLKNKTAGGLVPLPSGFIIPEELKNGWMDPNIPALQRELTGRELGLMRSGNTPIPWQAVSDLIKYSGCEFGKMVEIGCSTGYFYEALSYLLNHPIDYQGIDYSKSMIDAAIVFYPNVPFMVGDATQLPLANDFCDILISGGVLLHVPDYRKAISESARVGRKWVILSKTPVSDTATRYYTKRAYGSPCVELHFNESELMNLCADSGLILRKTIEIDADCKSFLFEKNVSV